MALRYIDDIDLQGKKTFIRVDFNVPLDDQGKITDDTRIVSSLPTITYAIDQKAKVILASHLGRPKGKVVPSMSLLPAAERLSELLNQEVIFSDDCVGDGVKKLVQDMKDGDVLLLENVRFHKEETKNEEGFAKALADQIEVYVNDAFGSSHRAHASVVGIAHQVPVKAAGFLLKKEIEYLGKLVGDPERPFIAILGGAKVADKIGVLENLLSKVDSILIGGGMAYTFLKAIGKEIGRSVLEEDKIPLANEILSRAGKANVRMELPLDHVVAERLEAGLPSHTVSSEQMPLDQMALDIGPETIKAFSQVIHSAKTIFWNGPMGVFEMEPYNRGTLALAQTIAETDAVSVVGGGDSVSAVKQSGMSEKITHISTGGGASLELVEGKILPGIQALES